MLKRQNEENLLFYTFDVSIISYRATSESISNANPFFLLIEAMW